MVGTDIILFGGFGSAGLANANAYLYSPGANTWTQKALCPCGARYGQSAAVVAGKMTIWGGSTNTADQNDMWDYDPATDRWEAITPFAPVHAPMAVPLARTLQGTAQYGDKMWIFGGEANATKLKDTWEYNFTSNTWTQRGDLPSATTQTAVAVIGVSGGQVQVLLFGGQTNSGVSGQSVVINAGPSTFSLYLPLVVR